MQLFGNGYCDEPHLHVPLNMVLWLTCRNIMIVSLHNFFMFPITRRLFCVLVLAAYFSRGMIQCQINLVSFEFLNHFPNIIMLKQLGKMCFFRLRYNGLTYINFFELTKTEMDRNVML